MVKYLFSFFLLFSPLSAGWTDMTATVPAGAPESGAQACSRLFQEMNLEGTVDYQAFRQAYAGYCKIEHQRDILTLIDFTKPSTEKRLYVFDMAARRLLYTSVVAHGRNSGENYATSFSNREGSYKSSLGFYRTAFTYQGKNGYSLVLDGLERGINDRARSRAIVMHGADYVDPSVIRNGGRLGRSQGCPAVPRGLARPIIDAIKGGSILYIHANAPEYLSQSTVLEQEDRTGTFLQ